jgi:hypothetical protein
MEFLYPLVNWNPQLARWKEGGEKGSARCMNYQNQVLIYFLEKFTQCKTLILTSMNDLDFHTLGDML